MQSIDNHQSTITNAINRQSPISIVQSAFCDRHSALSAVNIFPMPRSFLALCLCLCVFIPLNAQDKPDWEPTTGPKEFKALKYRNIGPAAGGRVSRAAGVPGNPLIYYAATASGGVWMSSDAAMTWKSIFDRQPVSSIGSIAVAPSDPNVVYVGSGEANIRGNVG